MRLTVHDHAVIHAVAVLSRHPIERVTEHDTLYRAILSEVLPGVNRRAPLMAPVVSVADMMAGGSGDPRGLSTLAAKVMLDWDRARLGMALDVIREAQS